jgi:membrane protein implicated in regulation of membrane protease activity
MERMPRFFLVVIGAVAAAASALIRFSELTGLTFIIGGIGLIILALVGFMASLTIPSRVLKKSA